jgi:hypothetical protein
MTSGLREVTWASGLTLDAPYGPVIVHEVPSLEALRILVSGLGRRGTPGVGMPTGLTEGDQYEVRVRNDDAGVLDQHGHLILSTSSRPFPLHTDGYNLPTPPHYAVLWRHDSSSDATPSIVADSFGALELATAGSLAKLREALFPSATGRRPALFEDPTWGVGFRWNPVESAQWARREESIADDGLVEILEEVDSVLLASATAFAIEPLDAVVLPNWRTCHGRGPLPADSKRALTRLWLFR